MDCYSSSSFTSTVLQRYLLTHHYTSTTRRPPTFSRTSININANATTRATIATQEKEKSEEKETPIIRPPPSIATIGKNGKSPPPNASPLPPSASIIQSLEGFINYFIDGPPPPSVDPRNVLAGNFSPVDELAPVSCPVVKGSIPPCLGGGAYIRNGPNPQHLPIGPYHMFDGDGMLHSLLLPTGGGSAPATFTSRFVQTNKYLASRAAGIDVIPSTLGSMHGPPGIARLAVTAARVLTGQLNPLEGIGVANTSVVYFTDRLLALGESDLPYAVHLSPTDGELTNVGRQTFGDKSSIGMPMTAHPKKDPVTGELFAFRYLPVPPFLTYFWFDREGNKRPEVPVFSMRNPSFLHDFAITERYAIFAETQIMMKPMDMLVGGGLPVGTDSGKVPRVGVLPRYATSDRDMRWFETPGFNPVHVANAWDEDDGGTIVLVAPNIVSPEHAMERTSLLHVAMEMVKIDLVNGRVIRRPLSAYNLDFPVVNPVYVGRKNRFAYAGVGEPMPKISGVVKLDYKEASATLGGRGGECAVATRRFGPGCFGGEPFFVPNDDGVSGEEDDGYLVSYVHDEGKNESKFVVMDAKSRELEIVAEVLLPRRVPYGFHGLFVTERELKHQRK